MKKQVFHDATTGILIGLILSIIFSFIHSPSNYTPLSPNSLIGQFMTQHQVHGSLVLLYCLLIWAAIGVLFSFGGRLFAQDWSLLRATVTHFFLMLLGFVPLAILAGWTLRPCCHRYRILELIFRTLKNFSSNRSFSDSRRT